MEISDSGNDRRLPRTLITVAGAGAGKLPFAFRSPCRCQPPPQVYRPGAAIRFRRCLAPGERVRDVLEDGTPAHRALVRSGCTEGYPLLLAPCSPGLGHGHGLGMRDSGVEFRMTQSPASAPPAPSTGSAPIALLCWNIFGSQSASCKVRNPNELGWRFV